MKNFLNLFLIITALFIVTEPVFAGLSTTMPEKLKQKNTIKNGSSTNSTLNNSTFTNKINEKTNKNYLNDVKIQNTPQIQTISQAEKEKYYENYLKYLEQVIKTTCGISEQDVSNNLQHFYLKFDDNYNLKDVDAYGIDQTKISKLFLQKFKPYDEKYHPGYSIGCTKYIHVYLRSMQRQKQYAQKEIIDLLKSYWHPTNANNSNCVVKVVLTFSKYNGDSHLGTYKIKSYNIVSSSNNKDFDDMVKITFVRALNWIEDHHCMYCQGYASIPGDMSIILKFEGNQISAINSIPDVNKQNLYTNRDNTETRYQSLNNDNTIEKAVNTNRSEVKNSGQNIDKSNNKENLLHYINNEKETLSTLYSYEKSGKYKINIPKDDYYKVTLVGGGGAGNKKKNYGPVGVDSGYNSYAHASGGSGASFYGDVYLTKGNHVVKVGDENEPTSIDDIIIAGAGGKAKLNSYNGDYAPFGGIGGSVIINSTKIKNYYLIKGNTGLTKQVIGTDLVQGAFSSYDDRINGYGAGGSSTGKAFPGFCKIEKIQPLSNNINEITTKRTSTSSQINSNSKYNIMNDNEVTPVPIPQFNVK